MAKKRVGKFPKAFRQMAVARLNQCENIVALAKELGVSRRLLYTWREKLEPTASGKGPPANAREATLRNEVSRLKRVLVEKVLKVNFSKVPCRTSRCDASGGQRWRAGIYAQIRAMMSRQGGLCIERMCQLAQVSRAGFFGHGRRSNPWTKRYWCGPRFSRSHWRIGAGTAIGGSRRSFGGVACW